MLIEQQIAERRERATAAIAKVLEQPGKEPYGDYRVQSASGKAYRVAMRGPGLFENYCSCPDFAVNTLGTCKHIEALLLRLGKRYGSRLANRKFARARASISLQYGDTIAVRLRLPVDPSPALRKLAEEYFDPAGLLRPEHYRSFDRVIDVLRHAELDAVVYSDVLEYLNRRMNSPKDWTWNANSSASSSADGIR
ncbi:MAG: SWIM zinc finger family protein [Ignavibacteriota bacterium]